MTSAWQGAPHFRRYGRTLASKPAISSRKSWGGYRRTPRGRFVERVSPTSAAHATAIRTSSSTTKSDTPSPRKCTPSRTAFEGGTAKIIFHAASSPGAAAGQSTGLLSSALAERGSRFGCSVGCEGFFWWGGAKSRAQGKVPDPDPHEVPSSAEM